MNSTPMENFIITDFSLDTILAYQLPCVTLAGDSPTAIPATRNAMKVDEHVLVETKKKRKAMEQSTCKSQIISPAVSTTEFDGNTKYRLGKVKKSKEAEETIHVRARRGHATDSHSLAERVRRDKINEKMRCLQDLVPGCDKTMGMAVMLEEITNYVHSLQSSFQWSLRQPVLMTSTLKQKA